MTLPIDKSQYTTAPRGTARQLMSLGRVLQENLPQDPPDYVVAAAERVGLAVEAGRAVYADRIRNHGPSAASLDREDDGTADSVLSIARTRLEDWAVFQRPTIRRMAADPGDGIDYEAWIGEAERAEQLHTRLFAGGFDATRAPYAEQAEYMITLACIIDEEQLGEDLAALMGPAHYTLLRQTITHYKAMVDRRQSGDPGNQANLHEVKATLQDAIQTYMLALLISLDGDDPDRVAKVRRALGPVDAFRATFAVRPRGDGADEGADAAADAIDPAAVEALAAAQQVIDAEIGFVAEAGSNAGGYGAELGA